MSDTSFPLDRDDVKKLLPHRDPMLFIDRVLSADTTHIHAQVDIDPTWRIFDGHFPHMPLMPGVLLIETAAQAGALIVCLQGGLKSDNFIAFSGVDSAKFRHPVKPGDKLDVYAEILRHRSGYYKFSGHIDNGDVRVMDVKFAATQMPI